MKKLITSLALALSTVNTLPFYFAAQAKCDDPSARFATQTDSDANLVAAKTAKQGFCSTLAIAEANKS